MKTFKEFLRIWERIRTRRPRDGAVHACAVHAPGVECIGRGKRHCRLEFGVKVPVTTLFGKILGMQLTFFVKALPGRLCDGRTPATILPDIERLAGVPLWRIFLDWGYKRHNNVLQVYEPKVFL